MKVTAWVMINRFGPHRATIVMSSAIVEMGQRITDPGSMLTAFFTAPQRFLQPELFLPRCPCPSNVDHPARIRKVRTMQTFPTHHDDRIGRRGSAHPIETDRSPVLPGCKMRQTRQAVTVVKRLFLNPNLRTLGLRT